MPTFQITVSDAAAARFQAELAEHNAETGEGLTALQFLKRIIVEYIASREAAEAVAAAAVQFDTDNKPDPADRHAAILAARLPSSRSTADKEDDMKIDKVTYTWFDGSQHSFWIRLKLAVSFALTPLTLVLIGRSIRVSMPPIDMPPIDWRTEAREGDDSVRAA